MPDYCDEDDSCKLYKNLLTSQRGNIKMSTAPEHLSKITKIDSNLTTEKEFVADVICTCGCDSFVLMHSGEIAEDGSGPIATEVDDKFYMIIKAKCSDCGKEHLIFDADYHGWNGYVCYQETNNRNNPRPQLNSWKCNQCSGNKTKLKLTIQMDKEVILDDGPVEDQNGNIILDDSNYHEGFDWISMTTSCASCGHKNDDWLSYETM
jgi:hypothetical protein